MVEVVDEVRAADNVVNSKLLSKYVLRENLRDDTGHDTLVIAEEEHTERHENTGKVAAGYG